MRRLRCGREARPKPPMLRASTPRPLLVLYPEVGMSDFVQDVSEHDALSSHLLEMFGESGERTPEWARMVRPVVPAVAEQATAYGARGRPRRPSGLQSSAAAARPPAVPPWSPCEAPPQRLALRGEPWSHRGWLRCA